MIRPNGYYVNELGDPFPYTTRDMGNLVSIFNMLPTNGTSLVDSATVPNPHKHSKLFDSNEDEQLAISDTELGLTVDVKIEKNTDANAIIVSSNTGTSGIYFGDTDDSEVAEIVYDHGSRDIDFVMEKPLGTGINVLNITYKGDTTLLGTSYAEPLYLTIAADGDTDYPVSSSCLDRQAMPSFKFNSVRQFLNGAELGFVYFNAIRQATGLYQTYADIYGMIQSNAIGQGFLAFRTVTANVMGAVMYINTNQITVGTTKLCFYGGTPITIPTIIGSRGGNAALAALLQALEDLGIIVDNTGA